MELSGDAPPAWPIVRVTGGICLAVFRHTALALGPGTWGVTWASVFFRNFPGDGPWDHASLGTVAWRVGRTLSWRNPTFTPVFLAADLWVC